MSPETGRERDDFIEVTLGEDRTYEAKTARLVGVAGGCSPSRSRRKTACATAPG